MRNQNKSEVQGGIPAPWEAHTAVPAVHAGELALEVGGPQAVVHVGGQPHRDGTPPGTRRFESLGAWEG